MNTIIPTIDVLKTVVKISASIPEESISPYIDDAIDIYIEPQVGAKIIRKALTGTDNNNLNAKILRCLGPLTLMLATPELGIQIGDAGITVDNQQGKRSPANEAKIAAAKESFYFRGMSALDRLLNYLNENIKDYPEYDSHVKSTTGSLPCFIKNAKEFQDKGMVNIDYSTITYRIMLPTIRQLQERNVQEMIPSDLYDSLLTEEPTTKKSILVDYIIRYLANKCAELYTTQSSLETCALTEAPRFRAIIRPIYQDMAANGNHYADQATYYAEKIRAYLTENASELGVTLSNYTLNFNSKEKHLFTFIS